MVANTMESQTHANTDGLVRESDSKVRCILPHTQACELGTVLAASGLLADAVAPPPLGPRARLVLVVHGSGLSKIQTKGRRRMGQEWPFEGRIWPLRADVLVSLAAVAPLFRRPARWR